MKHTIYALALVTSLATGIGAALAADATENDARAIATAKIGMTQAIQAAEQQVGGKASRAEFERDKKGQWVFDVEVVSAVKLDAAQSGKLSAALAKRLKRNVRMKNSVDATLLGGAVLRAGDLVIDGSLKGRLERLATELTS